MKRIDRIHRAPAGHWVGDGFPVRSMFSYNRFGNEISPFLLLDYAGPAEFAPSDRSRGVGEHPHRGFETVTIIYDGEVEHRDNAGNQGRIGPGDVQWMTAGRGVLHEEMHGQAFTQKGGVLEMVQLWVNLPAKDKMTAPAYQEILNADIPVVDLPAGAGTVRLIAGAFSDAKGPAHTFTPVNLWDLNIKAGGSAEIALPDGHTTLLLIQKGRVQINNEETAGEAELVRFGRDGDSISLKAEDAARALLMSGEPIDEPIVGYGPFVMNTREEIDQAIEDFRAGLF